ncbi:diguanylate cyclase [bacterium]|nr:diguanylate cyclase [bacterium]
MKQLFLSIFLLLTLSLQLHSGELEKVSLQLQWKHQFEYAGFYAAIEKGFYKDEGLEVELREVSADIDVVAHVLDGTATYGITYSTLISEYLKGKPVVLLANIFKHSALVLVSQKEINLPSDLAGKKVMGSPTELSNSGITMMLNKFNISINDIKMVQPTYTIDAFVEKKVDAMTAFITNQPFLLNQKNIKYTMHNPTSYGSQYYDVNLFSSFNEVQNNPSRTEAFTRASIKGWHYALQNTDEVINIILKKYNSQNKSKEALAYEAEITKSLILPNVYELGSVDCLVLTEMSENFMKTGQVPKIENISFERFLPHHRCSLNTNKALSEEENNYLAQKKNIRMCADPDWMPYEMIKENKHIGMSSEYMKIISRFINTPITLVPTTSWSESIEFAKNRKCDIFSLAMQTPERKKYMNFTQPYLITPLVIVTTHDKLFITDVTEVLDEKIGIVRGYAYTELLKIQYPDMNLIEVESINDGLQKVANGKLFGFIDNLTSLGYRIQQDYVGTLKITGRIGQDLKLGIGVRNDDLILLGILDKAISQIDEKEKQRILNQWISVSYEQGFDYLLLWKILGFIALVSAFLIYGYYTTNKHNKDMKKYIHIINTDVLTATTDINGNITHVSDAFCKLTGYKKEELIGQNHNIFQTMHTSQETYKDLWESIKDKKIWSGEFRDRKKDGSFYWVNTVITPTLAKNGEIENFNAISQDITDKKIAQQLSITDPLTQIYNRLHLENVFAQELERAKRYKGIFSIIMLDIDLFKDINDNYGHDVGDKILIQIVEILNKNIRSTDILGRWGGEEFLIICPEMDLSGAKTLAEKLRQKIEEFDFGLAENQTCSFGLTQYNRFDTSSNEIVKRADNALYEAKRSGRNRVVSRD